MDVTRIALLFWPRVVSKPHRQRELLRTSLGLASLVFVSALVSLSLIYARAHRDATYVTRSSELPSWTARATIHPQNYPKRDGKSPTNKCLQKKKLMR